jgi:glycosyltransferase involved in cell wall biosynthesis
MEQKRYPVSVCVVCFNEEKYIQDCLKAVSWADDIVVIDSFSTDKTVEIAARFTPRVRQREWKGYLDQKKYAMSLAKNEWVLLMDADEVMTGELAAEIKNELDGGGGGFEGFCFRRKLFYLNRWMKHGEWYPDYKLRLFKKAKAEIGGMEPHDNIQIKSGRIKYLKGEILHYSYENIADQIRTLNKYSSISAKEMFNRRVKAPFLRMLAHPAWRFCQAYILRRGFMDGLPGFIIAATNSFYVFLKYTKLLELYHKQGRSPGMKP